MPLLDLRNTIFILLTGWPFWGSAAHGNADAQMKEIREDMRVVTRAPKRQQVRDLISRIRYSTRSASHSGLRTTRYSALTKSDCVMMPTRCLSSSIIGMW